MSEQQGHVMVLSRPELASKIKKIEEKWQKEWEAHKIFEADPIPGKKKFFITFPFPYTNALPHLGSAFTVLRVDIMARYKRMRGYNVLFPQGWHATGGPIVASALRLRDGDEKIIRTLKMMGVPDEEIPKFKDPAYWVYYFTKGWKKDFKRYGLSIDWRREFFTTSLNPPYSKFVEWQYLKLKEKGLVKKGRHPVVWCPREKKVVGDHDRPDEYAGISPVEAVIVKFRDENGTVYPALTFRPETVFGVTNIWVNPDAEYIKAEVDGEEWILNQYMADELADQNHTVNVLGRISARELIGRTVKSPVGDKWVLILPASFVDPELGTGIVMSVPAHAPYDYVALLDLKRNPEILEKYGVKREILNTIEPIPLIRVPGYSKIPARDIVESMKIKDQHEKEKLEKATKEIYSKEYHMGVLLENTGQFSGLKVSEAKEKIIEWLESTGSALRVYTLPEKVYCRCGARTHVKIVDNQWFLAYSSPEWKAKAHKAVDKITFYPESLREIFHRIIDWYDDWACTHQRELGTPLPWDPDWVVESLSDSTIYMAYYTISKYLQHPEKYNIRPDQLKPEVFDYIFLGKGDADKISQTTGIPADLLRSMRKEFLYWYPVDLRISGKDLVQNHLIFYIFHHTAIFPEEHWPRGIGVNGWILVRGEKMSKTKGNFILLREALKTWGADATRWAEVLAGADPGFDDPNFEPAVADKALEELNSWLTFAANNYGRGRSEWKPIDSWFESVLNKTIVTVTEHMERTEFKTALVEGYYHLQSRFKWYLKRADQPHKDLLKRFIEVQTLLLAPFAPHIAEEVWHTIGKGGFVSTASWPEADPSKIDEDAIKAEDIIISVLDDARELIRLLGGAKKLYIIVAAPWKYEFIGKIREKRVEGATLREAVRYAISVSSDKKKAGKIAGLVQKHPETIKLLVPRETELNALKEAAAFLERELGVSIEVVREEDVDLPKKAQALPGKPALYLEK